MDARSAGERGGAVRVSSAPISRARSSFPFEESESKASPDATFTTLFSLGVVMKPVQAPRWA